MYSTLVYRWRLGLRYQYCFYSYLWVKYKKSSRLGNTENISLVEDFKSLIEFYKSLDEFS